MRLSRIHVEHSLETGARLTLDPDTSHYLGTVLRLRSAAEILVFNARCGEFQARLLTVEKRAIEIEVGVLHRSPSAAPLTTLLGLGISRGDRMDFAIQKATELGVSAIHPLYSQFGEVRLKSDRVDKKLQHWQRIAVSAAEQCGRLDIPLVSAPQTLQEWKASLGPGLHLILDPVGTTGLADLPSPPADTIALMIGPEGGFAEAEVNWARGAGFTLVGLGSRILRTETAPVAVLAILQHRFGDIP